MKSDGRIEVPGLGRRVCVDHKGGEIVGEVVGVATWGPADALIRGYVVALEPESRGYVQREDGRAEPRMFIRCVVASAVYPTSKDLRVPAGRVNNET